MKQRILLFSFLILLSTTFATPGYSQKKGGGFPYKWGVGVKLGDPLGLSLKNYFGNKALELIVGRAYYWGAYRYDYHFYHDNRFKNKGYNFVRAYNYTTPIAIQLHYLIHKPLSNLDGFTLYYGGGAQFRHSSYYYEYWDGGGFYHNEKVTDIGIGPDGVLGIEYTFDGVPISIGLDINIYMELVDRPFLFLGQGGLAARFNF